MRYLVNNKEVYFPSTLAEITLGQRILFYNQYGKELDEILESILKIDDEVMREIELSEYHLEKMFRSVAFFAGCTPEALKESDYIDAIANIYLASTKLLLEDEDQVEFKGVYDFAGEKWEIHPPELKHGSPMKFGEFIDAKQVVKNMIDLGKGRWESLLSLCAIYLRKVGEPYREEFMYEGSDRQELMKTLPMDIALAVGFFLSGSMNILMNSFLYSGNQTPSQGKIHQSILTAGDGLIS